MCLVDDSPRCRPCETGCKKTRLLAGAEIGGTDQARVPAASGRRGGQRQEQLLHAEHVDYSLEVIAEHAKGQFRLRLDQAADEESRIAHHPFHGSKGMFDQALPQLHPFAIALGATVHGLSGILVETAYDGAFGGCGALRLERALLAGFAVPVLFLRLRVGHLAHAERRSGWALIAIAVGIVAEAVAAKILLVLGVDRLRPRHDSDDLRLLTALAVLAIRIAGVRNHREALDFEHLLA